MKLTDNVTSIKGVGPAVAALYQKLGIETVADLIDYWPRRYDDYSQLTTINALRPGQVTLKTVIKQVKGRYVRRGLHITEAVASDDTGSVKVVWFNQPYRAGAIKAGKEYYLSGEFAFQRASLQITNPSMELVSEFPTNTARIVPIYRETKGLKSHTIRKSIREVAELIHELPETLPSWLIAQQKLLSRAEAVFALHYPDTQQLLEAAKRRLGFEEVFELSLAALYNKYELLQEKSLLVPFDEKLAKRFVAELPFTLTDEQRKVIWQIYLDMQKTHPMNRLVEGDVGSGKTVVATMAAVMAIHAGFQVALMAPTEILARQHAESIAGMLVATPYADKVVLLIGGMKPSAKKLVHEVLKHNGGHFVVGTHALIQDKVAMANLGLVVVDEQHRFGVEQRKGLQAKAGYMPHVLHMTATPIPRSLALTLYGELDISIIATMPSGRKPIKTKIVPPSSRQALYESLDAELAAGRQAFVVCPLISESDSLPVKSAEEVQKELQSKYLKHRRVGLLHGKMKSDEKDAIMQAFVMHSLDVLVSTTVIEVGVNVPNATVMVLEGADRFGLAQIHQLRGRVGRGGEQGYCYLVPSNNQAPSKRLRAVESSTNGFRLAELDLELRGPGAIYGTFQHGALDLRIAKLTDIKLITAARKAAQLFIDKHENLLKYHQLHTRVSALRAITNLN